MGKVELTVVGISEGTECAREVVRLGEAADSPSRGEAWLETWPAWPAWPDPITPPLPPLARMTAAALWKPICVGTRGVWNSPATQHSQYTSRIYSRKIGKFCGSIGKYQFNFYKISDNLYE